MFETERCEIVVDFDWTESQTRFNDRAVKKEEDTIQPHSVWQILILTTQKNENYKKFKVKTLLGLIFIQCAKKLACSFLLFRFVFPSIF